MTFLSPEAFLLLPALALAGWFWPGLRLHTPLRALVLLLAAAALAGPSIRLRKNVLDLVVLLDRSESTGALVEQGLPEWRRLLEESKPASGDTLRFINFGAEVAELGADGSAFTGSRRLTCTGLALSTAAAQVDPDRPARVLLFTDGYATEPLDEAIAQLQRQGTPLDFRLIRQPVTEDVRVATLDLPGQVQTGEAFPITVVLRGKGDAEVPLIVRRNGRTVVETTARLQDGTGRLEFTDRISQAGSHEYQVEVRPGKDAHAGNNTASRWIAVRGGPRLLLVTRYPDDPLAAVFSSMDLTVDVVHQAAGLHAGLLDGARAVVIHNMPAHELPADFIKALDFFVREQAGGLMMVGGGQSFGAGGYFHSEIDPLLPVSMELKAEHRKLAVALAIVMDRSGSMAVTVGGGQTKMDLANAGAAEAIGLLGTHDQATVFAVDSKAVKVVPLTTVGGNKNGMIARVRRIQSAGGGIFVHEGLEAGWKELRKSTAGTRHLILFSDAQDSEEPGAYRELIATMTREGCTLSVIGLGNRKDVDAALLEDIARLGKGRIFFSDQPLDVPKIFAQETATIARSAFIKEPVATQGTGRWAEISPHPTAWLPQVDGYNLSYARDDATVSLVSTDEYRAPLVAHARRGLGRTVAVSFPLAGPYSAQARQWSGYADFVQTLARFLTGTGNPPGMALRQRLDGTRLTIDFLYDVNDWAARIEASPPRVRLIEDATGTSSEPAWRRIEPGKFSLVRDLEENGTVRGAVQVGGHALAFGPVAAGAAVEWAFEPEKIQALKTAAAHTGGRELLDLSDAWLRPPVTGEHSLVLPLCVGLLLAMLAEALIARTGWSMPELKLSKSTRPRPAPVTPRMAPADATPPPPSPEEPRTGNSSQPPDRGSRFAQAKRHGRPPI